MEGGSTRRFSREVKPAASARMATDNMTRPVTMFPDSGQGASDPLRRQGHWSSLPFMWSFLISFVGLAACFAGLGAVDDLALREETAGLGVATPACAPVPGAEPLLAAPERRAFIVGELHGTAEIAPFFADLVCQAALRGPVIVGLEMPESSQSALDAWLASDGGPASRTALLRDPFWRFTDGRASQAMLDLLERLRTLKAGGRALSLLAFVPAVAPAATQTPYEQAMAANWRRALVAAPDARLLVLVGNIHSRVAPYGDFEPAAMHLPQTEIVTFGPFPVGGTVHNCQAEGCGPHPAGPVPRQMPPRGIIATPAEMRATLPYDYLYAPGTSFTPSPPAVDTQRPGHSTPSG